MSKLYSRPRTPPSPPPVSHKSSRSSRLDSKSYSDPSSKSYSSSKDYDKYGSYDKYERSKYEKSDKYDRYDKLDKPSYKSSSSYLSNKDHSSSQYSSSILKGASSHSDKYISKSTGSSSYQEDSYRSKGSIYAPSHSYSDRTAYVSKYPPRSTDKYHSDGKDLSDSKYSRDSTRLGLSSTSGSEKKYASYSSVGKTPPYSKYSHESNSYYPKGDSYHSYDSYSRGSDAPSHSGRGKGGGDGNVRSYNDSTVRSSTSSVKGYHNNAESTDDTYGGGYQRYVIGDSVVYGSPGHYPKDIYPPSPKAKRPRSPQSPPTLLSSSKMASSSKGYSRYSSSPKRYSSSSSLKGVSSSRDDSAYSRSSHRKPPSPPAIPYHSRRDDRPSRNYTPPPDRGKSFNDRFDYGKGGRYYDERESGLHEPLKRSDPSDDYAASYARRKRDPSYLKPPYPYQDSNSLRSPPNDFHPRERYPERVPKPLQPPKPLLSIPLSVNSIPKESRANVRETLGLPRSRPLNGLDRGSLKLRRLDGRIGSRKRALSPKDKRKRPDDLRLWIESRKTEGKTSGTTKTKGQLKRPLRATETVTRSRILDSRRRILTKGKRKTIGGIIRREPRRGLPPKPKSRDDDSRSNPDGPKKNEAPVSNRDGADVKDSAKDNASSTSKRRKDKKDGGSELDRDKGSEGTRGGGGSSSSGKGPGSNANTRRAIRRPRVVSQANRLPLKPRALKQRSSRRSPHDRDKPSSSSSISKSEKLPRTNNTSSRAKAKDRSRSRTRSRSRPSSRARPRSRSRSRARSPPPPRRSEKEETSRSSSSRH